MGEELVKIHTDPGKKSGRMRNDLLWMKIEKIEKKMFRLHHNITLSMSQ